MNKVQKYFKDYEGRAKCYETSDGLLFHEKGDANLHASSLKDQEVITHTAGKNQVSDDADAEAKKAADAAAKADAEAKKAANAEAKKAADAAAKK